MNLWGSLALALLIIPAHALALHPEEVFLENLFGDEIVDEGDPSDSSDCEDAKAALEAAKQTLNTAKGVLDSANLALGVAEVALETAKAAKQIACLIPIGNNCDEAKKALKAAQTTYNTAKAALASAEKAYQLASDAVRRAKQRLEEACSEEDGGQSDPRPRPTNF